MLLNNARNEQSWDNFLLHNDSSSYGNIKF